MSKAQSVHRTGTRSLWPWAPVAFLLGFDVSILMPPLLLVLIGALSAWILCNGVIKLRLVAWPLRFISALEWPPSSFSSPG
jgi:hypothetical protein